MLLNDCVWQNKYWLCVGKGFLMFHQIPNHNLSCIFRNLHTKVMLPLPIFSKLLLSSNIDDAEKLYRLTFRIRGYVKVFGARNGVFQTRVLIPEPNKSVGPRQVCWSHRLWSCNEFSPHSALLIFETLWLVCVLLASRVSALNNC